MASKRFFAIFYAILGAPSNCFRPSISLIRPVSLRGGPVTFPALLQVEHSNHENFVEADKISDDIDRHFGRRKVRDCLNQLVICSAVICLIVLGIPSPCFASGIISHIPTLSDLKSSLVSILDGLSQSGTAGMAIYTLSFIIWTMTVGVTTPIETAAGMAFPLQKSIVLSAIGKIGGAFFQYALAKYLFFDYAREKLKDNEWIDKINSSFQSHPYRVALIWRFSPLPEFVKNIGPALVPTLKTRYQVLATLTHGLPFTVLWSCIGNEAAAVARGGQASLFLKRAVSVISWVGLFVSPTLFGWWIKGLGESRGGIDDMPSKLA
jgi:uncharacterized membrane protein YdjX (TVP38/TMEM64 family)